MQKVDRKLPRKSVDWILSDMKRGLIYRIIETSAGKEEYKGKEYNSEWQVLEMQRIQFIFAQQNMPKVCRNPFDLSLKSYWNFAASLDQIFLKSRQKQKNNEISRSKSGSFQVRRRFSRCEIEQRAACSRGLKEQTERTGQKDTDQDKGKIINETLWLTQKFPPIKFLNQSLSVRFFLNPPNFDTRSDNFRINQFSRKKFWNWTEAIQNEMELKWAMNDVAGRRVKNLCSREGSNYRRAWENWL